MEARILSIKISSGQLQRTRRPDRDPKLFISSHPIQSIPFVAYRCEIVSEISCARPLAAFVSPSWLSGRPRPKIHVFRISLSVLRICSFFYPANPKIVAPKSTVSGQCASKFRGGNTRFSFGFSLFPPSNFDLPSFRSFLVCLSRASFNFLFSSSK